MGILGKIVKQALQPAINNAKGVIGEKKVENKLNSLIFGRVNHKYISNLVLVDEHGKTHQIDHVEIRENGIFSIETKNYIGTIYGNEYSDQWTQCCGSQKNKFLSPLKQNKSHVHQLEKVLNHKYHVNSVVVFVQNNANKVDASNVVNLDDLPRYLKRYNDGTIYSLDEMEEIYNTLNKARTLDVTNKEHVNNIKETQKDIKNGICPLCGGKLVERKGQYGSFVGCSNYPKCHFKLKK